MEDNATRETESIRSVLSDALEAEDYLEEEDDATQDEDVDDSGEGDAEITDEESSDDWVSQWAETHDKNVLPEPVRKVYDELVAGAHRVMGKADLAQKQAEARVWELEAKMAENSQPKPAEPTLDYTSDESLAASVDALTKSRADRAADERVSPILKQQEELQAKMRQLEGMRRYEALQSREGYTEKIGQYMDTMANKPTWRTALQVDPDGALDEMFAVASLTVGTAEAKAKATQAAKAKKSATKRPSAGSKSADGTPDLGGTFADVIRNTFKADSARAQ